MNEIQADLTGPDEDLSPGNDELFGIRVIGVSGREGKGENHFSQPRGVCINPATKERKFYHINLIFTYLVLSCYLVDASVSKPLEFELELEW